MTRLVGIAIVSASLLGAVAVSASEDFDLLDMIPSRFGPFTAFTAGAARAPSIPRDKRQISASYDVTLPGAISVVPQLRSHIGQPDAELICMGDGDKNMYKALYCNEKPKKAGMKPSKKFTIGGRELCVEPDQALPPGRTADKGTMGWNGNVTWSGWGDCSLTFARGLLGKKVSQADAAKWASEIAAWMEPFIVGPTPAPANLAENRAALQKISQR